MRSNLSSTELLHQPTGKIRPSTLYLEFAGNFSPETIFNKKTGALLMRMFVIINYIMNCLLKWLFVCVCWYLSSWLEKNKYLSDFLSIFFLSVFWWKMLRGTMAGMQNKTAFSKYSLFRKNAHFLLLEILTALILMYTWKEGKNCSTNLSP